MSLYTPTTTDLVHFREKDWVQARAYLGGGCWAGVLPTQKLLQTNQASPENFVQIHSPILKLFMIFCYTNAQTDRHTNSIQNESPLYRIRGEFFSTLFFLPLTQRLVWIIFCYKIKFLLIKFLKNIQTFLRCRKSSSLSTNRASQNWHNG